MAEMMSPLPRELVEVAKEHGSDLVVLLHRAFEAGRREGFAQARDKAIAACHEMYGELEKQHDRLTEADISNIESHYQEASTHPIVVAHYGSAAATICQCVSKIAAVPERPAVDPQLLS
jgi:hypothetical protein